jgi:hypothetical protein
MLVATTSNACRRRLVVPTRCVSTAFASDDRVLVCGVLARDGTAGHKSTSGRVTIMWG